MFSLFLAIWFLVFWARGYWYNDGIYCGFALHRWAAIDNEAGHVAFNWGTEAWAKRGVGGLFSSRHVDPRPRSQFLGFYFFISRDHSRGHFQVPNWSLSILAVMAFYFWEWRRKEAQRRLRLRGFCITCGYDLRGNLRPDACPECGTVV